MENSTKKTLFIAAAGALFLTAALLYMLLGKKQAAESAAGEGADRTEVRAETVLPEPAAASSPDGADGETANAEEEEDDDGSASGETPEERADREKVDVFDALVDKWREEESPDGVSMEKIGEFTQMFLGLPEKDKEDCLRRALNLVSDANFEVLVGLLVDRRTGDEFIQLIFDDMVNRSDEVKMTLLREIFKDKTHPCWAEAAWMLDAMDELGKEKDD